MNYITLDLDVAYQWWVNGRREGFDQKLKEVKPTKVLIRKSAFNGVHVRIEFDYELGILESLAMRAYLGDDQYRIYKDLQRFHVSGKPEDMMRLFDEKWYPHGKAGKWREI